MGHISFMYYFGVGGGGGLIQYKDVVLPVYELALCNNN